MTPAGLGRGGETLCGARDRHLGCCFPTNRLCARRRAPHCASATCSGASREPGRICALGRRSCAAASAAGSTTRAGAVRPPPEPRQAGRPQAAGSAAGARLAVKLRRGRPLLSRQRRRGRRAARCWRRCDVPRRGPERAGGGSYSDISKPFQNDFRSANRQFIAPLPCRTPRPIRKPPSPTLPANSRRMDEPTRAGDRGRRAARRAGRRAGDDGGRDQRPSPRDLRSDPRRAPARRERIDRRSTIQEAAQFARAARVLQLAQSALRLDLADALRGSPAGTAGRRLRACGRCSCRCRSASAAPAPRAA